MNNRKFILCADDYALTPGISSAIIELIKLAKIHATSCMSVSKFWPELSQQLLPYKEQVSCGIHLTLTNVFSLTTNQRLFSLKKIMLLAFSNKLPLLFIEAELRAQIEQFIKYFGEPQHIDGHQHIQLLPKIGELIIKLSQEYFPNKKIMFRNCCDSVNNILKRNTSVIKTLFLHFLSKNYKKLLINKKLYTNSGFRGVYNFSNVNFSNLLLKYTKNCEKDTIIMCHPGLVDQYLKDLDPVLEPREQEYQALQTFNLES